MSIADIFWKGVFLITAFGMCSMVIASAWLLGLERFAYIMGGSVSLVAFCACLIKLSRLGNIG